MLSCHRMIKPLSAQKLVPFFCPMRYIYTDWFFTHRERQIQVQILDAVFSSHRLLTHNLPPSSLDPTLIIACHSLASTTPNWADVFLLLIKPRLNGRSPTMPALVLQRVDHLDLWEELIALPQPPLFVQPLHGHFAHRFACLYTMLNPSSLFGGETLNRWSPWI